MDVFVKIDATSGNGLGPNFQLTSDSGPVTPFLVTKTDLVNGIVVSVSNSATKITITSLGTCTNSIEVSITGITTTTSSSSTTTTTTILTSTTSTTTTTTSVPTSTTTVAPTGLCSSGMDVVFIVDYNQAMGASIDSLKNTINNTIQAIQTQSGNNYRLGLVIVDEYPTNRPGPGGTTIPIYPEYDKPGFTAPLFASLPASQKYVGTGTRPFDGRSITQKITAIEMMSNNNAASFTSKLNQIAEMPTFPIGLGGFTGQPLDIAIDLVTSNLYSGFNFFTGTFRPGVSKVIVLVTNAIPSGNNDTWQQADIDYVNNVITPRLVLDGIKVLLLTTEVETLPFTPSDNVLYDLARNTDGEPYYFNTPSPGFVSFVDATYPIIKLCNPNAPFPTTTTTSLPEIRCCEWQNNTTSNVTLGGFTLCNPCCVDVLNFEIVPGQSIFVLEGSEIAPGFNLLTLNGCSRIT